MIHKTAPNGIPYLHFNHISSARVPHAVFTRHGGVSPEPWQSLNFSIMVGDSHENVRENNARAHHALILDPQRQINRFIVHSTRVWHVNEQHIGQAAPPTDAVVTRTPHLPLVMTFADCQPLIAYDPKQHILGLAHAGWRGTLAGIAVSLVQAMEEEGSRAEDIQAGLAPAIGGCCYEVGKEVAEYAATWPDGERWLRPKENGRYLLDITAANDALFRAAGVSQIEHASLCTACHTDIFFSYRAERPVTGRFAMIAALT